MELDYDSIIYEDDLPEMSDEDYKIWFDKSWISGGVRVGYTIKSNAL